MTKIRDRLQKHIHQYGSTYTLNELLEKNGLTFSSAPLLAYLEKKFC
ncbi:hypothetical protein KBC03_08260 [Patescibacteria group bacterium]|nr:hypothetical protein [Patescibacteria group bacterium]